MAVLDGKTAVVTGGSRGIGRAVVERLTSDGATVAFSYASRSDTAAELVAAVEENGGRAKPVQADFTDPAAPERLMDVAHEILGGLDILVNNAALEFDLAPIADTHDEVYESVMSANASAALKTVRYAAKHMRDNGRIVNISTLNTARPAPGNVAYAMSKGAIEQLTNVAAVELGARGITVNTVSPGATDTELLRRNASQEVLDQVASMTPLQRLGQPSDVADIVAFAAGPDSRWLTGKNLPASGGL